MFYFQSKQMNSWPFLYLNAFIKQSIKCPNPFIFCACIACNGFRTWGWIRTSVTRFSVANWIRRSPIIENCHCEFWSIQIPSTKWHDACINIFLKYIEYHFKLTKECLYWFCSVWYQASRRVTVYWNKYLESFSLKTMMGVLLYYTVSWTDLLWPPLLAGRSQWWWWAQTRCPRGCVGSSRWTVLTTISLTWEHHTTARSPLVR